MKTSHFANVDYNLIIIIIIIIVHVNLIDVLMI